MKKLFIAIVAIAAAAACSNVETVSLNQEAIAFDNAFVNNSTRIVDPSFTTETLNSFAVYGSVAAYNTAPATIFDNVAVSGSGIRGTWEYEDEFVQYWITGGNYVFAAVAPSTKGQASAFNPANSTVTLTNYENDGTTDLLYATYSVNNVAEGYNTKVAFDFKHALAKVKFSFTNAYNATNSTIVVKNVKINNAHSTGTVALTGAADWTAWEATPSLTLEFGNIADASATAEEKIAQEATADSYKELFLIPTDTDYAYNVTYTVDLYIGDTCVETYDHEATLTFAPAVGCCYNVAATITHENLDPDQTQNPIEFTVESLPTWTPSTPNPSVEQN